MTQTTALYGATDYTKEEAIGSAIEEFVSDLPLGDVTLRGWLEIVQVTTTGDSGAYSVEFTLHYPDDREIGFESAETVEVLR
jgi:hypothetical protein